MTHASLIVVGGARRVPGPWSFVLRPSKVLGPWCADHGLRTKAGPRTQNGPSTKNKGPRTSRSRLVLRHAQDERGTEASCSREYNGSVSTNRAPPSARF